MSSASKCQSELRGFASELNMKEAVYHASELFGVDLAVDLLESSGDTRFVLVGKRAPGLSTGETTAPACSLTSFPTKRANHSRYIAYSVDREHAIAGGGGNVVHLRPHQTCLLGSQQKWTQRFFGRHQLNVVAIDNALVQELLPNLDRLAAGSCALPVQLDRILKDLILYAASIPVESFERTAPHLIRSLLGVFALMAQPGDRRDSALYGIAPEVRRQQIKVYIEAHYSFASLSVSTLADQFKVSERYIHRVFATGGESPCEYLIARRLTAAKNMLNEGARSGLNITDIAFRSGFNSTSHFSTQFKRIYGTSPREYRRRMSTGKGQLSTRGNIDGGPSLGMSATGAQSASHLETLSLIP